jgi:hypothetical protein
MLWFFFEMKREEREIIEILVVENAKEGDKRRRFEITAKDYIKQNCMQKIKPYTTGFITHIPIIRQYRVNTTEYLHSPFSLT